MKGLVTNYRLLGDESQVDEFTKSVGEGFVVDDLIRIGATTDSNIIVKAVNPDGAIIDSELEAEVFGADIVLVEDPNFSILNGSGSGITHVQLYEKTRDHFLRIKVINDKSINPVLFEKYGDFHITKYESKLTEAQSRENVEGYYRWMHVSRVLADYGVSLHKIVDATVPSLIGYPDNLPEDGVADVNTMIEFIARIENPSNIISKAIDEGLLTIDKFSSKVAEVKLNIPTVTTTSDGFITIDGIVIPVPQNSTQKNITDLIRDTFDGKSFVKSITSTETGGVATATFTLSNDYQLGEIFDGKLVKGGFYRYITGQTGIELDVNSLYTFGEQDPVVIDIEQTASDILSGVITKALEDELVNYRGCIVKTTQNPSYPSVSTTETRFNLKSVNDITPQPSVVSTITIQTTW